MTCPWYVLIRTSLQLGDGNIIETIKQQNQLKALKCVDFLGQNLYACKLKAQKNEKKNRGGETEKPFQQRLCSIVVETKILPCLFIYTKSTNVISIV